MDNRTLAVWLSERANGVRWKLNAVSNSLELPFDQRTG